MEQFVKVELIKELKNVSKKMKDETDPAKKIFYYSAAYGVVDRSMRYSFSKDLLLAQTILQVSYTAYTERLRAVSTGDRVIPLTMQQLDRTAELVGDLAEAFKKDGDVVEVLENIMVLSYMTSGPGYYLQTNGAFEGLI